MSGTSKPRGTGSSLSTVLGRRSAVARGRVDAVALQRLLGLKSRYLAQRLLSALDPEQRGFASIRDFAASAQAMRDASLEDKVRFFFRIHDHDGSGRIDREELERMLHVGLAEQQLVLPDQTVRRLVDSVFSVADRDRDRKLSADELVGLVRSRPRLQQQLAECGVALLGPEQGSAPAPSRRQIRRSGLAWTTDRFVLLAFLVVYVLANAGVFSEAFSRYRTMGANIWIQIARGCGAALNLNGALILVPMLRHFWTWVRRRPIGRMFPIDDSVEAHRLVAEVLFALSVIHTVAHLVNLGLGVQPWSSLWSGAYLTGLLLLWVFAILWIFSRRRVRRSGDFEAFHFVHLLYVPWLALALLHGPVFWMWVSLPLFGYVVERLIRVLSRSHPTEVVSATVLPAGVTRLDVRRPFDFDYRAGDYAFFRLPDVARGEWHPFTLTSAPEQKDVITIHVRALGDWTRALRETILARPFGGRSMRVNVDGPYGAPATHIPSSVHAVAIAAGIGVTPFAAILRSLLMRREIEGSQLALRKLHFVWINREQQAFAWFDELLAQLEAGDTTGLLDIHIYMTAGRPDLQGSALELARELDHEVHRSDVVTGLQARTVFGRPDLDALLSGFTSASDLPPPDVYFCGPRSLSRQLDELCARHRLRYREERF